MVETDGIDRIEAPKVVAVGRVIAVPGHDIERGMVDTSGPQPTAEFLDQFAIALNILKGGHRRFKVARIGQAVGADRAEVGQAKRMTMVFQHIAGRMSVRQGDAELHATRYDGNLQRFNLQHTHFGEDHKPSRLRHDQQLAIGIEEGAIHRAIGGVKPDGDASLRQWVAIADIGGQAIDKVGGRVWHGLG